MSRIVVKHGGEKHFTKTFAPGTTSDRVILPGPDGVRVKVTRFKPAAGFRADKIEYDVDETVCLLSGAATIYLTNGNAVNLQAGDVYHVPAGVIYSICVKADAQMICVFSPAVGPLPSNE